MARIQTLIPTLWLETISINEGQTMVKTVSLDDNNTYLWYWKNGVKTAVLIKSTSEKTSFQIALEQVQKAEKKGCGAFASGPIPCNKNQHGVFAVSSAGETKDAFFSSSYAKIKNAHDSVFKLIETVCTEKPAEKKVPVQTIVKTNKNDPMKTVINVQYPNSNKTYTFRCNQWHMPGDKVCVLTGNPEEYKNVTVVKTEMMCENKIIAYAKSLGYDDLSYPYSEKEEDIDSLNYKEDINELNAMKEAYAPVCDYAPSGIDGYADYGEYDDLPE